MRAHGSSFLRIEILLALLAFPLFTAGCGPRQIWGTPADELKDALAWGQYAALASVDFATQDPAESLALSPDAPYALAIIFDMLGKPAQNKAMLELAWNRSPSPWREEAGALLVEQYVADKSYDKALEVVRRMLSSAVSPALEQRARRALVEALYWTRDDEAVLAESARLAAPDDEVLLFRAVSSLRLGLTPAHDLILRLFTSAKLSSLQARMYTFLTAQPAYLQLFSVEEQALMAATYSLAQGAWSKGVPALEKVLAAIDPARVADGALVVDLANAYGYAGMPAAGARSLEKLSDRLTGQARADALEQAGRLYRKARDYPRALSLLRSAAAASSGVQRDRAYWFILDIVMTRDPAGMVSQLEGDASAWSDPSYFSSLLQERIAELITARDWKTLAGMWRALESSGPYDVRAQLSYILARAWQEGAIKRVPGTLVVTARQLFQDAQRRSPGSYYGILAASMLGELPDRAIPADAASATPPKVTLDPVAMGLLPFGLFRQAYARLWAGRDALSDAELLEAARRFAAAGDVRNSMYLVGAVMRRTRLSQPDLELYYPRAYANLITPLAAGAGIAEHLLFGLVREESFFDAGIVSSAGAVGLAQLMPVTAASVARGLHIISPDLKDPTTNLTIGVRHLEDLLSNVDNPTKALLAYNAGLARVRQWERAAKGLPVDLFVESVPIAETRDYVRKILVSSVMYAFLYHDVDPRVAALSFFGIDKGALEPEPAMPGLAQPR